MAKTQSFDIQSFGMNAVKTVDSIRSRNNIMASDVTESRMAAFYRAIGLPAITDTGKDEYGNEITDPFNRGNVVSIKEFTNFDESTGALLFRDTVDALNPVTPAEVANALDFSNFNINSGVTPFGAAAGSNSPIAPNSSLNFPDGTRIRGLLFPMVTLADLQVLPQNTRVAPAFYADDKDITFNNILYRRPFIETVISITLRTENLNNSSVLEQQIIDLNIPATASSNPKLASLSSQVVESIQSVLYDALQGTVLSVLQSLGPVRNDVRDVVMATADNVPGVNLDTASFSGPTNLDGTLSIKQQNNADAEAVNKIFITLLDTYSDQFVQGVSNNNVKDTILSSDFFSSITTNNQEIYASEAKDDDNRLAKITQELQSAQATLDLLTGQFSGLSGVDVLVIFLALFTIPMTNLVGLLNNEAIGRLNAVKGTNFVRGSITTSNVTPIAVAGVEDSVLELQNMVVKIYSQIQDNVKNATIKINQNNGSTSGV